MKVLFSHQNYPAQFGAFGAYLAKTGWDVTFFSNKDHVAPPPGCRIVKMSPHRKPADGVHRFAKPLEKAMINGQAFANSAIAARAAGLEPDVVVAHSGWGSGTFAKAVWPSCKYVSYVEWFYRWPPADAVLQNPQQTEEDGRAKALAMNAPTLLDLVEADLVLCPTHFQARQFPDWLRQRITVLHDGVDTEFHKPEPNARIPQLDTRIPPDAEIVSYATRGMEPHRGFPEFMRALELLQKRRPRLHAVIGGQDRVAYGPQLADGKTWKRIMLDTLDLDETRIHWPGLLARKDWRTLLQSTQVHVYLTVPFVLSWSMIEAMATGTPLVVSDTAAVTEALTHDEEGLAVDHSDPVAIADAVERLLDDRDLARRLGAGARARACRDYATGWIYPAKAKMLRDLLSS
jgi:glycosyltransferase involved in cell wall biosynthesis